MINQIIKQFKEKEQLTKAEDTLIRKRVDSAWDEVYAAQKPHLPEIVYEFNWRKYLFSLTAISVVFLGLIFYLTEPKVSPQQFKTNLSVLTAGDNVTTTKSVDFNSKNIILDFAVSGPVDAKDALDKLSQKLVSAREKSNLMYGRYETYSNAAGSAAIVKDEIEVWYDLTAGNKRYKIVDNQYTGDVLTRITKTVNDGTSEYVFTAGGQTGGVTAAIQPVQEEDLKLTKVTANSNNPEYIYDNSDPLTRAVNLYQTLSSSASFDELVLATIQLEGTDREVYKVAYNFPYKLWDGDRYSEQNVKHILYLDTETLLPLKEIYEPDVFSTRYSRELAYMQVDDTGKNNLFTVQLPEEATPTATATQMNSENGGTPTITQKNTDQQNQEKELTNDQVKDLKFRDLGAASVQGKLIVAGNAVMLEACSQTYVLKGTNLFNLGTNELTDLVWLLNGKYVTVQGGLIGPAASDKDKFVPELVVEKLIPDTNPVVCLQP